jgi:hypothetical protein
MAGCTVPGTGAKEFIKYNIIKNMAKEDFCFTYYDGDAARDKSHMTRLERGAYDDIISAQRKRGHLSLDDIKRVLSKDFESCWASQEWILKKDAEEKYFIEWVDESLKKSRENSKKQKAKSDVYWSRKNAEKQAVDIPQDIQRDNNSISLDNPLEDGYEDGYGIEEEKEEEKGGAKKNKIHQPYLVPEMFGAFKQILPAYPGSIDRDYKPLFSIANFLCEQGNISNGPENNIAKVMEAWRSVCLVIKDDPFYSQKSLSTISNHIQEILQNALHGKKSTASKIPVKPTVSDLQEAHARRYPVSG